jgi:ribose 5-phosphate isomerase A
MSDPRKAAAARAALQEVRSGMLLGLGTGSTAHAFLIALAESLREGRLSDVRGVPTSRATERTARELGIPLADLPAGGVDLAIDGMDEVDPRLDAVKGLGGALLREKVVAESAARFVLIGDDGKTVARLGERAPVPVEVLAFGIERTTALVEELGLVPRLRGGATEPQLTDNGNPVLDADVPDARDPRELARALDALPGVLGHGLFLGMANAAYLAGEDGVELRERPA